MPAMLRALPLRLRPRRDLARRGGVAERDQALAFQPVERGVVGEVVAVAMRHRGAEDLAALIARGEDGVGALDAQMAVRRQEAQPGVAQQGAGQQPGFGEDLEAVAHAEHVAAARGEVAHGTPSPATAPPSRRSADSRRS